MSNETLMPLNHYYHAATFSLGFTNYSTNNKRLDKIGCINFSRLIQYIDNYLIEKKEIYLLNSEDKKTEEIFENILNAPSKIKSNILPNKSSNEIFNDIRIDELNSLEENKKIQKIERDFCNLLNNFNAKINNNDYNINDLISNNTTLICEFIKLTISRSPAFNTDKNISFSSQEIAKWFEDKFSTKVQTLSLAIPTHLSFFLNDSLPIFPILSNKCIFPELPWLDFISLEELHIMKNSNIWIYPVTHKTLIILSDKNPDLDKILSKIIYNQKFFDIIFSVNLMICSSFIVFNKQYTDYFLKNSIKFILKNPNLRNIRKINFNTKLFNFIHKD